MARLVTFDLDVIEQRAAEARTAWEKAKADLVATKAYASANHVSPGNDYWVEEHRLRARHERLCAFLDAVREAAV